MTRVGWLADASSYQGGAEFTQAEFRAAAPETVEIIDCPPGAVHTGCDVYAIHNAVTYSIDDLSPISDLPTVKYWHDVGPWIDRNVREWLDLHALPVCCSPLQAEHMRLGHDAVLIPPPVDLARFAKAAESVNGDRAGTVCVASWQNAGKGARNVLGWEQQHENVDFFGGGPFKPAGSVEIEHGAMPALLARYRRFVYLPSTLEPFGRLVAEAHAAGCEIVTNELVGATYWLRDDPDAILGASAAFWEVLCAARS